MTKDDETPMAQLRGCMNRIEQEDDACRNCWHLESQHRLVTFAGGEHFDAPALICPVAHVFKARKVPDTPPLSAHDHGNCELCDQIEAQNHALMAALKDALDLLENMLGTDCDPDCCCILHQLRATLAQCERRAQP